MTAEPQRLSDCWGFEPASGTVVVAGSKVYPSSKDRRRMYSGVVIGVDMLPGEGVDLVHDLANPLPFFASHIDCCSVLEHCADPFAVARNLSGALIAGGTILFSVPFCWRPHAYPNDYWRFTVEGVKQIFPAIDWQVLEYAYDGKLSDRFGVSKQEKFDGETRIPKAEVVGWGVKR